jgi:hypothetical protein
MNLVEFCGSCAPAKLREARLEIKRLTYIVNDRQDRGNDLLARAEQAEAEVERLKGELRAQQRTTAGETNRAEILLAEIERLRNKTAVGVMDWADEKAREWMRSRAALDDGIEQHSYCLENGEPCTFADTLAALLREQKAGYANSEMGNAELCAMERASTLADVRRVVEEIRKGFLSDSKIAYDLWASGRRACDGILARLEEL